MLGTVIETMNKLFSFYLQYIFSQGQFWGYAFFKYNKTTNEIETSKKLLRWNYFIVVFIALHFLSTLTFLSDFTSDPVSFMQLVSNVLLSTRALVVLHTIVTACSMKGEGMRLAKSALKLKASIGVNKDSYHKIAKRFTMVFIIDMIALAVLIIIAYKTSAVKFIKTNYFVWNINHVVMVAFKQITTSYIFTLLFVSELARKLSQDIQEVLRSANKSSVMLSKECCVNLDYQLIMYQELIEFVKEVQSETKLNILVTILTNIHDIVYLVSFSQASVRTFFHYNILF